ncbi:MAG: PAS domain-containing sensor histidine kinase [Lachnospiraceae bacterium]|nr:PAS domain-containing sensor histidine kinase [Lachnospiraceae bacterium]
MKKFYRHIVNVYITVMLLTAFFGICLLLQKFFDIQPLIPAIFTLAVFLISKFTTGYLQGIIASFISILAVNFAFTFPYFKLQFTISEDLISAIIMLAVTITTSTMTTQIKKQEKMRAEMEMEKMRSNLLRAVSHDIRTPLTTIYGSSSTLIENYGELPFEQKLQLLNGIKEDSEWLIDMVENLLSVTKIDNVNVRLKLIPTPLEELIDTVLVKFKKRYPDQTVEIDIPEEFISIPMDSILIGQVVLNLLENAVQHASGMTRLALKVFLQEGEAVFEICDDGCGIPKDKINNLFNGYMERKNENVDCQKHCMGIGLYVCASIVRAHNGKISAENNKMGGSCFRFSLKLEEEDCEQ